MIRGANLHFSSLLRPILPLALITVWASASANYYSGNSYDLIPSQGTRPELVAVLDMRKDYDDGERLLARSLQGLVNSQVFANNAPSQNTDKIYLILNDTDEAWLKWLVAEQYVLSAGYVRDLDHLLRRYHSRKALLVGTKSVHELATRAGRQRLLLAADKKLVHKYDLDIDIDSDDSYWLDEMESYDDESAFARGDREKLAYRRGVNKDILILAGSAGHTLDLIDYQVANRVSTIEMNGDSMSDDAMRMIKDRFDHNIPVLSAEKPSDLVTSALSSLAKFVVPLDGLSNLSFWTTFRPFDKGTDEVNSGAVRQPRSIYLNAKKHEKTPWEATEASDMRNRVLLLHELAPPICEDWTRHASKSTYAERESARLGVINADVYGSAFGKDRDRIWNEYLRMSRQAADRVSKGY